MKGSLVQFVGGTIGTGCVKRSSENKLGVHWEKVDREHFYATKSHEMVRIDCVKLIFTETIMGIKFYI